MRRERGHGGPAIVAVAVVIFLMIYVLATGPLQWLWQHVFVKADSYAETCIITIYRPITSLTEICPPLNTVFEWYLSLFQ